LDDCAASALALFLKRQVAVGADARCVVREVHLSHNSVTNTGAAALIEVCVCIMMYVRLSTCISEYVCMCVCMDVFVYARTIVTNTGAVALVGGLPLCMDACMCGFHVCV